MVMVKIIAFLCLIALPVWAQQIPANNGKYIVDTANVLGSRQLSEINEKLASIEKNVTDHPQVMALIVPTTGEQGIDDFATKVFEAWKPGTKEKDNGLLLVIATQDHKVAIRTGGGTGYRITDTQTRQITDAMKPNLQAGDWYNAILVYMDQSQNLLKVSQETPENKQTPSNYGIWIGLLGFCLVVFLYDSYRKYHNKIEKINAEIKARKEINSKNLIMPNTTKSNYKPTGAYMPPKVKDNRWNQGPGKSPVKSTSPTDDSISGAIIGGVIGSVLGSDDSSSGSSSSYDSGGGSTDAGGSSDSF